MFFVEVVLEKKAKHPEGCESCFLVQILEKWWAYLDLNQGPHPYQGCTLTS